MIYAKVVQIPCDPLYAKKKFVDHIAVDLGHQLALSHLIDTRCAVLLTIGCAHPHR